MSVSFCTHALILFQFLNALLCVCFLRVKFGFRKWKSHVTERPFEDRSEIVKELYSDLSIIKPNTGQSHVMILNQRLDSLKMIKPNTSRTH